MAVPSKEEDPGEMVQLELVGICGETFQATVPQLSLGYDVRRMVSAKCAPKPGGDILFF